MNLSAFFFLHLFCVTSGLTCCLPGPSLYSTGCSTSIRGRSDCAGTRGFTLEHCFHYLNAKEHRKLQWKRHNLLYTLWIPIHLSAFWFLVISMNFSHYCTDNSVIIQNKIFNQRIVFTTNQQHCKKGGQPWQKIQSDWISLLYFGSNIL